MLLFVPCFLALRRVIALGLLMCAPAALLGQQSSDRDWLRKVRIGAYSLTSANADQIVKEASASGVYGIEVDNDIPGRYESLLQPEEKLAALRKVSVAAHSAHNKVFVYIAGLECISAQGDSAHTLAKEHPDWLQRKVSGEPAIFDTKAAFWIAKGEEDVWVSPYASEWRKLYMERVRQIAATGVDGIYVDIPYWMTHFQGWEDSWASFDDKTVAAFRRQTGLDARKDIKLGDAEDPGFRKWVNFRIQTITDFMAEIRSNAVGVSASISVIPEIYPGIEDAAPRVGADVYQLYPVVDAIAHEYEFGEGDDHTAASRTPLDWMNYQIGMRSFRAFAEGKPTWILNYSWDGAPRVAPRDAMLNLAMSELMAGANIWDAQGHVMSGSNDMATRKEIFDWVERHEDIFGAKREPVGDVGVYFSDATRNLYPGEFVASYRGTLLLLLQQHIQFQVVTPRTLRSFRGKVLVLPDVRLVSEDELRSLTQFDRQGGRLVMTGKTDDRLAAFTRAARFPASPERQYLLAAEKDFDDADPSTAGDFLKALQTPPKLEIMVSKRVVVHLATIAGREYLFLANFDGLKAGEVATPTTQRDIPLSLPASRGSRLHVLPFLGEEYVVEGKHSGTRTSFVIPQLERGSIAWLD